MLLKNNMENLGIKFEEDFAQIEGLFGHELITCSLQRGGKKSVFYDKVPYEKLSPIMVTRDNIDLIIIDGGFHRREQVYLNLD